MQTLYISHAFLRLMCVWLYQARLTAAENKASVAEAAAADAKAAVAKLAAIARTSANYSANYH